MNSLISIIIPTFNRAHFLGETLESILAQTYQNWECIVVDDGSTDNTFELLNTYIKEDSRIKYFLRPRNSSKGASSCRNIGFEISRGDFIQYLDSDDIITPTKLEDQLQEVHLSNLKTVICSKWALFSSHPSLDSKIYNLNFSDGEYSSCAFLQQMGKLNSFYPPHCYLTPKTLIENTNGWNENLTNNDDAEFFTRVLLNAEKVKLLPKVLAYYRKSTAGHLSNYSDPEKIESVIKSWKLIQSHILKYCNPESLVYYSSGRNRLFHTLKNKYPLKIVKHKTFFQEQLKEESYRLNRLFILKKVMRNFLQTFSHKLFSY